MDKNLTSLTTKGLTKSEINDRIKMGEVNSENGVPTKTIKQIIFENVFTFFNIVNFVLAGLLIYVGSYRNLLFLGVVILNILIGIIQEIKAKSTIDSLSLIAQKGAKVIRDGIIQNIPDKDLVKDEIMILEGGDQIPVDATLISGNLEVDESLLTGESNSIEKKVNDPLYSGSFVISGNGKTIVTNVGNKSYAGKLATKVKKFKKRPSEIQSSLDILIKAITVLLIPIGILMFLKEFYILDNTFKNTIVTTTGSLIALIPSGLVLLTSSVFVVSVLKLSKYKTLVQEMSSTETLARVDTLCLDKTGTITKGNIKLIDIIPFKEDRDQILNILRNLSDVLKDNNPTLEAIREEADKFKDFKKFELIKILPFSSARKYSGAEFKSNNKTRSYIMGAGSFVLGKEFDKYKETVDKYTEEGKRVLFLTESNNSFKDKELPKDLNPIAILIFSDEVRSDAKETLDFFEDQGVRLIILSGDDPKTVSIIANQAGFDNADKYIDATTLKNKTDIDKAIDKYSIYGRVTPEQKKEFVESLQNKGHTVAMTGDGVNDTLALKTADVSIAMASGSDAARNISNFVLIDSNFSALPKIVAEGRQVINNLQRSSSLYLSKTIFSILALVIFLFTIASYPFQPIQLTLINTVTIGIPSVVLALEPNKSIIKGRFFTNILRKALPAGLISFLSITIATFVGYYLGFSEEMISTISIYLMVLAGFLLIIHLSIPFNFIRSTLLIVITAIFFVCVFFFKSFFYMVSLGSVGYLTVAIIGTFEVVVYIYLSQKKVANYLAKMATKFTDSLEKKFGKK